MRAAVLVAVRPVGRPSPLPSASAASSSSPRARFAARTLSWSAAIRSITRPAGGSSPASNSGSRCASLAATISSRASR
ncbi:hypothetical protein O1L44_32855 [Streptomyces noursei]|nr:hypothetical protein [Streptomyces noursei]